MDPFEIEDILSTFEICVDTREQATEYSLKRYKSFGCSYHKQALSYGDYTYNLTLPDGTKLYKDEETISAKYIVIERKMHLDELAMCFTSERKRFEKEFCKIRDNNCKVILLVENATWENLINGKYRSKFHKNAFFASIIAWLARYNIVPIFCKAETSGRIIKEILYRDAKERLERGDIKC